MRSIKFESFITCDSFQLALDIGTVIREIIYLLSLSMQNLEEREELFRKIASFLEKYGATKVAVFGSYVRGEEKPESDIDILVEFAEQKSLLTLVKIEMELSDYLGIKVDLLTEKSISPYLIDGIKKEARVISKWKGMTPYI